MIGAYRDEASPWTKRQSDVWRQPSGRPTGTTNAVLGRLANQPATTAPTTPETPTGSGVTTTQAQSPYAGFLAELAQPIQYQDLSGQRLGLARETIQRGTQTGLQQARRYMGGRGFRGGESGIADTAFQNIIRGGQEQLGTATRQITADEAARAQGYAGLNLQRMLGGGQLGLGGEELQFRGEESSLDRMMQMWQSLQGSQQGRWQPYWQGVASGY